MISIDDNLIYKCTETANIGRLVMHPLIFCLYQRIYSGSSVKCLFFIDQD